MEEMGEKIADKYLTDLDTLLLQSNECFLIY